MPRVWKTQAQSYEWDEIRQPEIYRPQVHKFISDEGESGTQTYLIGKIVVTLGKVSPILGDILAELLPNW